MIPRASRSPEPPVDAPPPVSGAGWAGGLSSALSSRSTMDEDEDEELLEYDDDGGFFLGFGEALEPPDGPFFLDCRAPRTSAEGDDVPFLDCTASLTMLDDDEYEPSENPSESDSILIVCGGPNRAMAVCIVAGWHTKIELSVGLDLECCVYTKIEWEKAYTS